MSADRPAVSLVLNIHNEARFLNRTMIALEEAVRYAAASEVDCEIVCVLDRANAATQRWIEAHDYRHFVRHAIVNVDNGSLGLSRNDGIAQARGDYIFLCDADDLVSYNIILGFHNTAIADRRKCVVFAEYLIAFGSEYSIARYFGTETVSKLGFFQYHPYGSRIFAHRSLFETIKFNDARLSEGFAYEDWHFNCEALANGCEFRIARQTMIFYRQRPQSLVKMADAFSARAPMYSELHNPERFIAICKADFEFGNPDGECYYDADRVREGLLSDFVAAELMRAANIIDPAIDPSQLQDCRAFSNVEPDPRVGAAYYRLCSQLFVRQFSQVFLVPFMAPGDGDKYVLDLVDALIDGDPGRQILIVSGQRVEHQSWLERLPANVTFIDIPALNGQLTRNEVELIALRLIQACARGVPIFLKWGEFPAAFFKRFKAVLPDNPFYLLRAPDVRFDFARGIATSGKVFEFMSEYGDCLAGVITDNQTSASHDSARLDFLKTKISVLYPPVVSRSIQRDYRSNPMSRKLLWASPLAWEKRPGLLAKIGRLIDRMKLDVSICIFGCSGSSAFDLRVFDGIASCRYCGDFQELVALQPAEYDALLYTTVFDGMPGIVLEALNLGLIVIAPDVGGISEVITPESGFLVEDDADDERLAVRYVKAIGRLYAEEENLSALPIAARELIVTRHSRAKFASDVRNLLPSAIG